MDGGLSPSQLYAVQFTERFTSALSALGFLFIFYTYIFCRGFKKPINRLIFYAAWSNLGTTIAGLIAHAGITAGQESGLCQFQAFMIQLFQGVDVYWALCMSLNVYLALFHGWNTRRMRSQEWKYLCACYGFSLIPAVVYLLVDTGESGKIYGPATIWCWITPEWSFLRVGTLYGIVWLALLGALVIYCIALAKAWRHRRALIGLLNPLNEDPFGGTITTDIEVVITTANGRRSVACGDVLGFRSVLDDHRPQGMKDENPLYTVNVRGADREGIRENRPRPELLRIPSLTRAAALAEENREAWLYARVAFLYFVVMIICWTPASINRLVSLIDPSKIIFGLNYIAVLFLPLQGFLNALVYCVSSQTGVRNLLRIGRGRHANVNTRNAERIPDAYLGDETFVFQETASPHPAPPTHSASMPRDTHRGSKPLSITTTYWGKNERNSEGENERDRKGGDAVQVTVSMV